MTACLAVALAATAAAEQPLTFPGLRELIATHHVRSIEQLLAALPPELRGSYTLVFASRSLQEASTRNPRVILFGPAAQLIITFNGEPAQRGYETLETMEFVAESNTFAFREIRFDAAHPEAQPQISAPNGARCAACHGDPPRPIWDTLPAWPGVYGERYGAGLSSSELQGMRSFLDVQRTHPRYQYLLYTDRLLSRDTYVADSHASYNGTSVEPPNAQLAASLTTLNVRSILAQLAGQPGFTAHLSALLAAAGDNCGAIANFYPPAMQAQIATEYQQFAHASARADKQQREAKSLRRRGRPAARGELTTPSELAALRFVTERSLHLATDGWTLAFERGSYDLSTPPGALSFEQALYAWLAAEDSELPTLAAYRTFSEDDAYCQHLRHSSQSSLTGWYRAHPPQPYQMLAPQTSAQTSIPQEPPLLQACIACHGTGVAPPIPFANRPALHTALLSGQYPRGRLLDEILFRLSPSAGVERMPRGTNMSPSQQGQLELYFIDVARNRNAD